MCLSRRSILFQRYMIFPTIEQNGQIQSISESWKIRNIELSIQDTIWDKIMFESSISVLCKPFPKNVMNLNTSKQNIANVSFGYPVSL